MKIPKWPLALSLLTAGIGLYMAGLQIIGLVALIGASIVTLIDLITENTQP